MYRGYGPCRMIGSEPPINRICMGGYSFKKPTIMSCFVQPFPFFRLRLARQSNAIKLRMA
jgi:hypothetical protein